LAFAVHGIENLVFLTSINLALQILTASGHPFM
jgi:hypothetical protein